MIELGSSCFIKSRGSCALGNTQLLHVDPHLVVIQRIGMMGPPYIVDAGKKLRQEDQRYLCLSTRLWEGFLIRG